METALESASVAQLLGEDSDVSIGEDEDCDCADQDGLSMENARRGEGGADSAVGWKGVCIDTKAGFSASCKIYESLQPHDDKMRVVMQGWLENERTACCRIEWKRRSRQRKKPLTSAVGPMRTYQSVQSESMDKVFFYCHVTAAPHHLGSVTVDDENVDYPTTLSWSSSTDSWIRLTRR
uniref:Uncharacterized protein n=1 Tax=Hyaloperonospora arabidopsidis (strain Emoy2) TaxID=559515 RepID=M4BWE6_HYAAE